MLACTVDAGRGRTIIIIFLLAVGVFDTATTALLGDVLAGVVHVTEVGGTGIAIGTVLVGLTAGVIGQQVTLRGFGAFPDVACGRSIRVFTALNFQKLGRTALGATFGCVFMDTLRVDTRVRRTRGVVVTVLSVVTATVDGRIVADVVCRTLIFRTGIVVVAIHIGRTAIELLRIIAITCREVTDLKGTCVFIVRTVRVLLAATWRQKVDTLLGTHVARVSRTDITVIARRISLSTEIRVIREDAAISCRFADVQRGWIVIFAF